MELKKEEIIFVIMRHSIVEIKKKTITANVPQEAQSFT